MVTADEARKELARRELARRRGGTQEGWSPKADADLAERITGKGSFADATGSGIAKAVPFGDEIASGFNAPFRAGREWLQGEGFDVGRAYDRNMQTEAELQRRREERSPVASTAGAIAGAVGAGGAMAKSGLSLLQGAKPTLASMGGRGAAEGAAYGAAYGAGEGRGLNERASNALYGAGFGATTGAAGGAAARIGAGKVDTAALPTADDLKQAAKVAYQQADDAGVVISKDALGRVRDDLVREFTDFGYHPELQSGAKVALSEIDRLAGGNATLKGVDTARKIAGNAFQPMNKSNNALTGKVTSALDDLVANPRAGDILAGDAQAASQAIKEARGLYGQSRKLETVQDLMKKAGLDTAVSGSGGNIENATRRELKRVLANPKLRRGFSPDELKALEKAVFGTPTQNTLRWLGKMSPEGNGLTNMLHILSGGTTLPFAGVGFAAKRGADAMSKDAARVVEALIAAGGKALPQAQLSGPRKAVIDALMRSSAVSAQ